MTDEADAEERAQFMLRMRARGIRDLALLRALERAPRSLFMPQRYQDIAARDIALPIGCGQTAPPPSVVATMIESLKVNRAHSVFEIGAGTGYATALLSQLARRVLSVERCRTLAVEASARLKAFGVVNAEIAWADGLSPNPQRSAFDRIIIHSLIESPANNFTELLNADGILVAIAGDDSGREQRIIRISRDSEGRLTSDECGHARAFTRLAEGLIQGL